MAKLKPNQFLLSGHLITEIPMLYQTEMVRAICADRKTLTRRIVKGFDVFSPEFIAKEFKSFPRYGKIGDLHYVRETHQFGNGKFYYKSDMNEQLALEVSALGAAWKPSIHMPKSAARTWLMVEDIRVERLQDISQADAIAEGIEKHPDWQIFKRYDWPLKKPMSTSNPYVSFMTLWKSINGEESWNENPWVWVIKFRVLSKTGRPSDAVILENYLEVTGKGVGNE